MPFSPDSFPRMPSPPDFAFKLRLTAAALGCATRKELCQRFRAVNPATHMDLERCHKWLQGAAMPRSAAIYDDWAALLGPGWSAPWIAASAPDAFAATLCERLAADREALEARAAGFGASRAARQPVPAETSAGRGANSSCFVAYSWAMSPRFEGQLIRGLLTLGGSRAGGSPVSYEEGFATGPLCFDGMATWSGRTLHIDLAARASPEIGRFFMVLLTPGQPLNALCGEFLGAPVHDSAPKPAVSRIALLRISPHAAAAAAAPGCYLPAETGALSADLAGMGFQAPAPLAHVLLDLLAQPRESLARTEVEELARLTAAGEAASLPMSQVA